MTSGPGERAPQGRPAGGRAASHPPRAGRWDAPVRWGREVAYIVGFYVVYTVVRNQFGSGSVDAPHAYANAVRVIDVEKALRIFNEDAVQSWFLGAGGFLHAVNIYYGTLHFLVPIAVLVVLAVRSPAAYRFWRTALLAATGIALVGFALFPLMPPRLLCDCAYGAGPQAAADGLPPFVDTLAVHGGLWSFDTSTVQSVSNQYAAMPSLHVGWALWCALALIPRLRRRWTKALVALYPVFTVFTVVVTGNHYWLDAVGGAVVVGLGCAVAWVIRSVMLNRRVDGDTVHPGPAPAEPDGSAGATAAPVGGRSTFEEASVQ